MTKKESKKEQPQKQLENSEVLETEKSDPKADIKRLWQNVRSLVFFFLLLFLIPQIENWIGQENIKQFLYSAGIWAPISFVFIRLLTVVIAPLRLGPITALMHRAFGLWPSLAYSIIVVVLGSTINFFISKKWGNQIIGFFFGPDILKSVDKYAEKYLNGSFKNTCLMFLTNYELISYASGLTGIKWYKVVFASFLSSLVTAPLLIFRDLSIGNNDLLATGIFILSYFVSLAPMLFLAKDDINIWWKAEMNKIKNQK